MTEIAAVIAPYMTLAVSSLTLFTFVRTKRIEAEKTGAQQANLANDIKQIKDDIKDMTIRIANQQSDIDHLKLWMELLLQQHNANHGQEIRR